MDPVSVGVEAGSLSLDAAKPVIGTFRKIYKTKKDKVYFRSFLKESCVCRNIDKDMADKISSEMTEIIDSELKEAGLGRARRAFWWARTDRGPGIDRLTSHHLQGRLDIWYCESIQKLEVKHVPETIGTAFMGVVYKESSDALGSRGAYAKNLLDSLERNNSRSEYWSSRVTVAGGLGATGAAGALATGVAGAVDTDLKTALTVLVGIMITMALTKLVHYRADPAEVLAVRQANQEDFSANGPIPPAPKRP